MAIRCSFFGKNCLIDKDLKNRSNLNEILKNRGYKFDNILLLNQIHSNLVVVIDDVSKIYQEQDLPKADAIITNLKNVAIGIVTADCSPILLYSEEKNIIAAIHAGWKGAKNGVIKNAVEAMKNLGAGHIKAKIGPMIQQDSYQVSQEFYDDFIGEDFDNKSFFISDDKPLKYRFDLTSYVEKKLKIEGINEIDNPKSDTYKNEEKFFSFRRSNHQGLSDCGRNISIIMID
jgi:YfiH family protein